MTFVRGFRPIRPVPVTGGEINSMSAFTAMLEAGTSQEVVHQLVLKLLLREHAVSAALGLGARVDEVEWEPDGGEFDLLVRSPDAGPTRIEVKVGSWLKPKHLAADRGCIEREGGRAAYFLISFADFEWNEKRLREAVGPNTLLVTTQKLRDSLASSIPKLAGEASELATEYAAHLSSLLNLRLAPLPANLGDWKRLEHSIFYQQVQRRLSFETAIYTAPNAAGGDFILNVDDPTVGGRLGGDLGVYLEAVDGVPRIKVHMERIRKLDREKRAEPKKLRDDLRAVLCPGLAGIGLRRSGRLGGDSFAVAEAEIDLRTLPIGEAATTMEKLFEGFRRFFQSLKWDGDAGTFGRL